MHPFNWTFLIPESDEDVVDGKDFNPLVTCAFTLLATLQTRSKTAFKWGKIKRPTWLKPAHCLKSSQLLVAVCKDFANN